MSGDFAPDLTIKAITASLHLLKSERKVTDSSPRF